MSNNQQLAMKEESLARPLSVLVPLIKEEIELGNAAGLEHYRAAGELLLEAKAQVGHGEWKGWLKIHFALSQETARRYMALVPALENPRARGFSSMRQAIRPNESRKPSWHEPVKEILTERITPGFMDRIRQEEREKEKERQVMRALAKQIIDIGYRVLATKLHPDKAGSQEAMARLNRVRNI